MITHTHIVVSHTVAHYRTHNPAPRRVLIPRSPPKHSPRQPASGHRPPSHKLPVAVLPHESLLSIPCNCTTAIFPRNRALCTEQEENKKKKKYFYSIAKTAYIQGAKASRARTTPTARRGQCEKAPRAAR